MEALETQPAGQGQDLSGIQPAGDTGSISLQPAVKESLREKWRRKYHERKARKQAQTLQPGQPTPLDGQPMAGVPVVESSALAPAGNPGPVPWTADTARPAIKQLIPVVEAWEVNQLRELALTVHPDALQVVSKYKGWSPPAKATIEESGSQVVAKWMNRFGVSADDAHEVFLLIAAGTVYAGHQSVKTELLKLKAELEEKAKPKEPAPAK
jgi:hypothetical protein